MQARYSVADHLELQLRKLPSSDPAIQPATPTLHTAQAAKRGLVTYAVPNEDGVQKPQVLRQAPKEFLYEIGVLLHFPCYGARRPAGNNSRCSCDLGSRRHSPLRACLNIRRKQLPTPHTSRRGSPWALTCVHCCLVADSHSSHSCARMNGRASSSVCPLSADRRSGRDVVSIVSLLHG